MRLKEFSRDVAAALPFPDRLCNFHINVDVAFSRLCFFRGKMHGWHFENDSWIQVVSQQRGSSEWVSNQRQSG